MAYTISSVHGREVLDSRGNPTIEVELTLSDGSIGRAIVPSGASKGQREALELRDGDRTRFLGKGVLNAVKNVDETIGRLVGGRAFHSAADLDKALLDADGSAQKSRLGANSMLGVSLAFANACAMARKQPLFLVINEWMGLTAADMKLPLPLMNVLNGGVHANNGLEIQEFMIVPHGFETFSEALRAGCEIFQHLKEELHSKHLSTAVGDEGGFAPAVESTRRALELIADAIQQAGYSLGEDVSLALDVASSSFYDEGKGRYLIKVEGATELDTDGMIRFYESLLERFPIVSIEDGLEENDWDGWSKLTAKFGGQIQLVGDDLFVTQPTYVRKGIAEKAANSVLVKVNQVGTLAETFETMKLCREAAWSSVVSHRSGETEDVAIAHLAVGSGAGQIKTGSLSRGERTAKYNELLRIEEWGKKQGRAIRFEQRFGG